MLIKKIVAIAILLLLPIISFANVENDVWSYVFHLEYSNNILSVSKSAEFPYSPIPEQFIEEINPDSAQYYGVVFSVKGKTLAKFGVPPATSAAVATGISSLDVKGPYFANADKVTFYSKDGKRIFDISVAGSSFCNDNNKCNSDVGENYINCPLDCPAPANTTSPLPLPTPTVAPDTATDNLDQMPKENITTIPAETSYVVTTTSTPLKKKLDTKAMLSLVGGILIILFVYVFYRVRKNMD